MAVSRRAVLWGAGGTFVALGIASLVAYASYGRIATWYLRSRYIPKLEKRLGRDIEIQGIEITRGHLKLTGISVRGPGDAEGAPLLEVARVEADFDWWAAVGGEVLLGPVEVERPRVSLVTGEDGVDNWRDALEKWRGPKRDGEAANASGGGKRRRVVVPKVTVLHGGVAFHDRAMGVRGGVEEIGASWEKDGELVVTLERAAAESTLGPALGVDSVVLRAQAADPAGTVELEVRGGRVAVWRDLSLTGIRGTVKPEESGKLSIDLDGGYGGVEGTLWRAEGWLDAKTREGDLHVRGDKFSLEKLAPILEGSPVKSPAKTMLSATLDLKLASGVLDFDGQVGVEGLTVAHAWLADRPIPDLTFTAGVHGRWSHGARRFELDDAKLDFRGITPRVEGYVALPGGKEADGTRRAKARLRARLVVPPVTCQKALKAFPKEITPRLQGFQLKGTFDTDVAVDIDWADLERTELGGSVGIFKCKVLKAPKSVDTEKMLEEFEHAVEVEKDQWLKFVVGPSNPNFTPLTDVSPYLVKSILSTEDTIFYKHKGFIPSEFRTALVKNLQAGYFRYGASSITMQFVKNVMLHRQKTIARKLQELVLAWYVEQTLEKDRILEIYLNVIEFGPGLYGIGPASWHYFGKPARALGPVEAAFFSSILPNPKRRHLQYCDGKPNRWTEAKVRRILKVMLDRERLTQAEYDIAMLTPLVFRYPADFDAKKCRKYTEKVIKNARSTTPPDPEESDLDAE